MVDVEPVRIVTGEVGGGASAVSLSLILPWVMMGVGLVLMVGVALHSVWRWYGRLDERERAFLLLSLRLRVGRRERAVVRRMAAATGAAPVALLVSETAFRRGVEVMGRGEEGSVARGAIGRLEGRVF